MKRVLITGSSGFIAGHLRRRLEEFKEAYDVGGMSLRAPDALDAGLSGWDCVVHTAGIAHVRPGEEMAAEYERVNRDLTLAAAGRAKADGVRQFVFLSSMIVYGPPPRAGLRRRIGTDTPTLPENAYGRSKLEAEAGLRALADEDFRVAIVRPPMVYGKGGKGNYNALARMAVKLPAFPDFKNERSILYVENLAECLRLIIDGNLDGLFHPQDERIVSTSELAAEIARAHGRRIALLKCLSPAVRLLGRGGPARRAFGDMAYEPELSAAPGTYRRFDFETAVRRTEE